MASFFVSFVWLPCIPACFVMTSSVSSVDWERQCFYLVLVSYDLCCTRSDDHAGRHRVTSCYPWHSRCISDAKVVDAVDLQVAVNDGHRVTPHPGGGCLMPKAKRCIADVVFQFWTF